MFLGCRYTEILAQFGIRASQINVRGHRFSPTTDHVHFVPTNKKYVCIPISSTTYEQSRNKYLPGIISVHNPTNEHIITLMNSNSQEKLLNVVKFLMCAFNLRSSEINANT